MTLRIVNKKKNPAKYEFGARRNIKLNYALTIDQHYILFYNNTKIIYYIIMIK